MFLFTHELKLNRFNNCKNEGISDRDLRTAETDHRVPKLKLWF